MATGTVKRLSNVTKYAFVVVEGGPGEELFFHRSAVADDGFDELRQGQRVTFDVVPDPRNATKRQAIGVKPVEQPVASNPAPMASRQPPAVSGEAPAVTGEAPAVTSDVASEASVAGSS